MTRRPNHHVQGDPYYRDYWHAAVTADTEWTFHRAGAKCRVVGAWYMNPTGLAEDPTNTFALSVRKNGTTTLAGPLSSDSDGAGTNTIVGGTYYPLTLSETESDLILEAGDVLSLLADEGGTSSLPLGQVLVRLQDL